MDSITPYSNLDAKRCSYTSTYLALLWSSKMIHSIHRCLKIQTMCISKEHEALSIKLYGKDLEQVTEFTYLGSCIAENNSSNADICTRITKALSSFGRLQSIWKDKEVSLTTKVKCLQALVFPIICYACETWTLKADVMYRLEAFEM